ncbi:MAG: hypothetical protein J2P21_01370, partial [Chloracidobacterium sp.]|nr:hypothetical protein [Chloracidobacterium sp.]
MIATSAMRCYIRAFNFRLERYICITMENFTFNSEGAPGSDETEESISSPGDVSRDSLEISLRHLRLRRMQQV